MFGRKPQPVAEHEARGETARIYHEIRQTLRVSGVNLNFRTWAGFETFFPAMWAAVQPTAASQAFESSSDDLRARAADLALALPALDIRAEVGESQRYQIAQALALYHYINPKLLLLTVLVRRGLTAERQAADATTTDLGPKVPFGAPPAMAAMEMVDDPPADARLRRLFRDISNTMALPAVNSDYRTLALWPDYLEPGWAALKRVVRSDDYRQAAAALAQEAATVADRFPTPTSLNLRRLKARGVKTDALLKTTIGFERLLPPLILNIALLTRDWRRDAQLRVSPFPLAHRILDLEGGAS